MDESAITNGPVQSIVRIYLRRRSASARGVFKRMFAPQLSTQLVKDALVSGISYATVTLGHSGFVAGASRISCAHSELEVETLPTCVELIAPRQALRAFVNEHAGALADAVMVWLDGATVSLS